ncbi:MAG: leucyl aminopeptidase [Actinomycetota bacterium]|nr:leucyl aminopeptidase [Actinomycetota bacterium]
MRVPSVSYITDGGSPSDVRVVLIDEDLIDEAVVSELGSAVCSTYFSKINELTSGKVNSVLIHLAEASPVFIVTLPSGRRSSDLREAGALIGNLKNVSRLSLRQESNALRVSDIEVLVNAIALGSYEFNVYRSEQEDGEAKEVVLQIEGLDQREVEEAVARGLNSAWATCFARDLVNEPPSRLTPEVFAQRISDEANGVSNLVVEVWDRRRIEDERLGGLLGVAAGSVQDPRVVKLSYKGEGSARKVALVGKGITFDSGGLNIKTFEGMKTMKTDMAGAAAVMASTIALAKAKAPVEIVAFAMLTENMPSGSATKPGDVLVTRSGQTIEVLNTDAEGRLVLSDGLTLAREEGPDYILDLATLTGACVVALGDEIAGILGNNDELISEVIEAGKKVDEELWHLPIPARYRSHIKSEIADMRNIGETGQAGATAGALLLERFVGDVPWAHLDIAGPSRSSSNKGVRKVGGTGFGAALLIELLS